MAGPLNVVTVSAPGFYGLNTQESGITMPSQFALDATNCIIDKFGRIGSRKGWIKYSNPAEASITAITQANPCSITASGHNLETGEQVTITGVEGMTELNGNTYTVTVVDSATFTLDGTDSTGFTAYTQRGTVTEVSLLTGAVGAISEFTNTDGSLTVLLTADNKLWKLDSNYDPVELTADDASAITITSDNWQIATFNNHAVFVQDGHVPVYYDAAADTYKEYSGVNFTNPTCVSACFNRVWVGEDSTVYWSKILEPQSFTGVGSGYINMREIFGEDDTVTAITSYNGRLVIFGKRNIAFFSGAEDPTGFNFQLSDHIKGIGCIARDSVQNVGTDVVFLSSEGVRTVGRTIQEVSSPIGDVSRNIRDDLVQFANGENEYRIKAVYSPLDAIYLLTLPTTGFTYCFDMRAPLQDGSRRVTVWNNITPSAYCVLRNNDLLLGQTGYVGKYSGYSDNGTTYRLSYYTSYIDFGNAASETMLKKIRLSTLGAAGQDAAMKWAFDYDIDYETSSFKLKEGGTYEYGVDEYFSDDNIDNEAEYSSGLVLDTISFNASGRGAVLQLGIESNISGGSLSIQKIDIFAKNGKLIS